MKFLRALVRENLEHGKRPYTVPGLQLFEILEEVAHGVEIEFSCTGGGEDLVRPGLPCFAGPKICLVDSLQGHPCNLGPFHCLKSRGSNRIEGLELLDIGLSLLEGTGPYCVDENYVLVPFLLVEELGRPPKGNKRK